MKNRSFQYVSFLPRIITNTFKIVLLGMLISSGLACKNRPGIGYNQGHAPEQPIPYDHELHAGKLKIDCLYCHANAEISRHASVPSLNICMNCHLTVGQNNPNIDKLREAYNNKTPIKWAKVHMLPDFVHFNHKRHVQKGVACQTCHGPIETMKKVKQHSDLSMGWCVNCHREPEHNAPLNCTTCHQ